MRRLVTGAATVGPRWLAVWLGIQLGAMFEFMQGVRMHDFGLRLAKGFRIRRNRAPQTKGPKVLKDLGLWALLGCSRVLG